MRYAQRGGYTLAEQQRRERLRLEAAGRFARGETIREIAHDLRVAEGSVRRWRRMFADVPGLPAYLGTVTAPDGTALVDLLVDRNHFMLANGPGGQHGPMR